MSATLTFIDNQNNFCHPWECQCVLPLSNDEFERAYGMREPCGCSDRNCNMSNRNARIVLSSLGFDSNFEESGPMLPQELHAACNRYLASELAMIVDNGRESKMEIGEHGCVVIECGLRENYITDRVTQIRDLCAEAMLAGAMKCYFC